MLTQIVPRCPITIRVATMNDYAFVDRLQKMHAKMVGFMQRAALEGKIAAGQVLIAEEKSGQWPVATPIGYCIAQDRYFKRDDIGVIYQLNVMPNAHRKLIGAMLIKAVFERAAYGCKLFCCWCAQDIEANYFWESLGFVPLAFRSGSRGKQRTHIFWQKRIREGDTTTPYWFPSQTSAGSIREDRLVLPLPPGTCWKDAMPMILPREQRALPDEANQRRARQTPKGPAVSKALISMGGIRAPQAEVAVAKPIKQPRPKVKNDPALVAAARELRDRYLEQFNSGVLADGSVLPAGKYDVTRQIEQASQQTLPALPALPTQPARAMALLQDKRAA